MPNDRPPIDPPGRPDDRPPKPDRPPGPPDPPRPPDKRKVGRVG